jgi:exportin-2 (importin alpha re-exporter)
VPGSILSTFLRFIVQGSPTTLPKFEQTLFTPFISILQQDIERELTPSLPHFYLFIFVSEYIPYVFQVLAQMLDLHSTGEVPPEYRDLLHFLFTPAIWQQKGSIPGLVKLLKAFLVRDAMQMFAAGQIASVLAVVQQRLIPSKVNDAWGFELIQSVVLNVKPFVKLFLVF